MGASQSTSTPQGPTFSDDDGAAPPKKQGDRGKHPLNSKVINTPIYGVTDDDGNASSSPGRAAPIPTGNEYDLMDQIASDLPSMIDDESKQQVEEYIKACDGGKGPMVACFSTAEYLSLFLRKHGEAADLYENTCFRPKEDRSPNGVDVDGTRAYPPGCFNLGQMRMTGKGRTRFDRAEGHRLFDRACRGGHGGACYLQAKMLLSYPGSLGEGVPYDPPRAAKLLEHVCEEKEDSVSCFTLATMLLRGDRVNAEADNVSPEEARGLTKVRRREREAGREKLDGDERKALERDPVKAAKLLQLGCSRGHAPSCYNMAVMFTNGDEGVDKDEEKAKEYQEKTEELVKRFGGMPGM